MSSNPLIRSELIPNSQVWFAGAPVNINSDGFRDREYSIKKPENITRIIALGDSFTFGYGIPVEDTWPKLLEEKLGDKYEVLNFGVNGYNTINELEMLKHKGLKYEPDVVVVMFAFNDLEFNSRELKSKYCSNLLKLNSIQFFNEKIRNIKLKYYKLRYGGLLDLKRPYFMDYAYFRDDYLLECFDNVLDEFVQLSNKHNFELKFIILRDHCIPDNQRKIFYHQFDPILNALDKRNINYFDTFDSLKDLCGDDLLTKIGAPHQTKEVNCIISNLFFDNFMVAYIQ